jgi:outer membrane lipoprotein-sorting protein
MSIATRNPALRWLAPVAVVAVVAGAAVIGHSVATGVGAASLPELTAAQLVADIERADVSGVSGTVVESADLGLPSLPGLGSADTGLTGLITGTHTLRVWYGGQTKQRVALLQSMGESDIIRNGTDLWTWDSSSNAATHRTLPAKAPAGLTGGTTPSALPVDPQQAAQSALTLIGKTTTVTVDNTAVVAGRAAYELVLSPKGTGSLVSSVRIAVDGATYVPLRVEVDSVVTKKAAFSIGFTSVDFGTPDSAEFAFTPPPGATLNAQGDGAGGGLGGMLDGLPQITKPSVVGTGWTSVLVAAQQTGTSAPAGSAPTAPESGSGPVTACTITPASGAAPAPDSPKTAPAGGAKTAPTGGIRKECSAARDGAGLGGLVGSLTRALPQASGSWGSGKVLAGTLFTLVITDDHRIAVGAVTPEIVYAALSGR